MIKLNFKPKVLHLGFRPMVYMRDKTHTYLWVRDEEDIGYFLTMDTGSITLERIDLVTVYERDERNRIISHSRVYRVYENKELYEDLVPYEYNPMVAVQKYHESLLARTPEAEREMLRILEIDPKEARKEIAARVTSPEPARPPKAAPRSPGAVYSLSDLCSELKMDPSEARKILRSQKVQKPGSRWDWPNREAAASVRAALGG